ncbi:MAG TPA: AMP-binding protein [Candidatus Hydrogenedentes bacterium]|nr:AMP-binding protein [Candidatus Hydrogenedentota bacterium]
MTEEEIKPWVDGLTFHEVVSKTVADHPNNDAVVFPRLDLRWSYETFQDKCYEMARALLAMGVQKGDHIGIWSTNWPEWILTQFSTAYLGAVLVNVNPAYRQHELSYILKQANISMLFVTDTHKTSDYVGMVANAVPEVNDTAWDGKLSNAEYPKLQHVVCLKNVELPQGVASWDAFIAKASEVTEDSVKNAAQNVIFSDPVNIQYTSGTTGDPKGAMLSHRNLLMNAFYCGQRENYSNEERVCIPVPFYHCFGCVIGTLTCAVYGSAMVVPAESFEPGATLEAVTKENCTVLYGVPTMFSAQVNHPDFGNYEFPTLRTGMMAGSPCPIELMKQVVNEMNLTEITIGFGQTETSPIITQCKTTDSLETRVATVGSPLPGVEVRIVDPETLEDVAQGEQGEFWARGHCIMLGYYNNPEATANTITPEGWLRTGDLATETPEGFYKITGRIKDMIIRGGENIYPAEIENFLMSHPDILEVQVAGLPDIKYVEQVSAWIIPKPGVTLTVDDVKAFCKEKIAHYKIPHYVTLLDEFPLTVTGKIQKFKLRDMGIEEHSLQDAAAAKMA